MKKFKFLYFDIKNELGGSILVGKVFSDAQNGSFLQILDQSEERLYKSYFDQNSSIFEFFKCHKICNFRRIFTIPGPSPTKSATESSILPSEITFSQVCKNLIFLPLGGRFKSGFFEFFSKLGKDIDKQFSPADHPPCASPELQSNHGTKTTRKREKSKNPIFRPPKCVFLTFLVLTCIWRHGQ